MPAFLKKEKPPETTAGTEKLIKEQERQQSSQATLIFKSGTIGGVKDFRERVHL